MAAKVTASITITIPAKTGNDISGRNPPSHTSPDNCFIAYSSRTGNSRYDAEIPKIHATAATIEYSIMRDLLTWEIVKPTARRAPILAISLLIFVFTVNTIMINAMTIIIAEKEAINAAITFVIPV